MGQLDGEGTEKGKIGKKGIKRGDEEDREKRA